LRNGGKCYIAGHRAARSRQTCFTDLCGNCSEKVFAVLIFADKDDLSRIECFSCGYEYVSFAAQCKRALYVAVAVGSEYSLFSAVIKSQRHKFKVPVLWRNSDFNNIAFIDLIARFNINIAEVPHTDIGGFLVVDFIVDLIVSLCCCYGCRV